jgi:hypothetical protein
MHRPERWGFVQFSTNAPGSVAFAADPTLPARDWLMGIYHRQRAYRAKFSHYADTIEQLGLAAEDQPESVEGVTIESVEIKGNGKKKAGSSYVVTAKVRLPDGEMKTLHVQHDSRLW